MKRSVTVDVPTVEVLDPGNYTIVILSQSEAVLVRLPFPIATNLCICVKKDGSILLRYPDPSLNEDCKAIPVTAPVGSCYQEALIRVNLGLWKDLPLCLRMPIWEASPE